MSYKIILSHIINPRNSDHADQLLDMATVILNERIVAIGKKSEILRQFKGEILDYSDKIAIPPFYDLHFHWVQEDVRDKPKESLLEWLSNYTWPTEALYKDLNYAKERAQNFKRELLKNGTLGGSIYSSLHDHTVDLALQEFVGEFICGNVLMTMNSPEYLSHTPEVARRSVLSLRKKYGDRYVFTPRFAITTDPLTMRLGHEEFVKSGGWIQSHLCETQAEIEYVLSIYKKMDGFLDIKTYTEIYDRVGLLSPKTLMAHGIYLTESELLTLQKTDTILVHCPTSNAPVDERGLGSGLFDFNRIDKKGIRWGLGSDIGGGPYLSMFDVIESFVKQNHRAKRFNASYSMGLFKATIYGARLINPATFFLFPNSFATFLLIDSPKKMGRDAEESLKNLFKERGGSRDKFFEINAASFIKGVNYYERSSC